MITGEFIFTATDGDTTDVKSFNVDEWVMPFTWVSPAQNAQMSGPLVLDWSHSSESSIVDYELRLGYKGTDGGNYFGSTHTDNHPYEYGELSVGFYWHGIFANNCYGNSIHAFTEFIFF